MKKTVAVLLFLVFCFSALSPVFAAAAAAEETPSALTPEEKEFLDGMVAETAVKSVWRNAVMMNAGSAVGKEFSVAAGEAYELSGLTLDAEILKTVYLDAENATDSDKLKISWTTEASPAWDDEKSFVFTVEKGDKFVVNDLVLAGAPSFGGVVTAVKLEMQGAASGTLEVAEMRFLPTLRQRMYYGGKVEPLTITDDKQYIKIAGKVNTDVFSEGGEVRLYRLGIWENGIEGKEPEMTADKASFEFLYPLGDAIYDKFAVTFEKDGAVTLLDEFKFVENPEILAENVVVFPDVKTKKGFHVESNYSEAAALGCRHSNCGIQLNAIFRDDGVGEPYEYKGLTYYVNTGYINVADNIVKTLTDSGCVITMGFILYKTDKFKDLYHPNAAMTGNSIGLNTTTKKGCEEIEARISYVVERYTRPDAKYGTVYNWMMGNEVGSAYAWNDMGDYPVNLFIRDYERALRILDMTVRRISANGRSYVSFDALWDRDLPTTTRDRYDNRVIVDVISAYSKASGDYNWNIAHHAYPQTLARPKFWQDKDATEDVDTDYVNFKNLHILTDYLRRENNYYKGGTRRVILTEQGFNCTSEKDNPREIQAAAFAYAYYECLFDDVIDSFQYYRMVDHEAEAAMNFRTGVRRNRDGTKETPGEKRPIYELYKYIDTEKGLEIANKYLSVLDISSWKEVVPAFDESKLVVRELSEVEAKTGAVSGANKRVLLTKATGEEETNDEERQGWDKLFYCGSFVPDERNYMTVNLLSSVPNIGRGIFYKFNEKTDLSATPVYSVRLNIDKAVEKDVRVQLVAVADDDMMTASAVVTPGKTETVSFDFSDFSGIKRVTSLRLVFIGAEEEDLPTYEVRLEEIALMAKGGGALVPVIIGAAAALLVAAAAVAFIIVKKKKKAK